MVVLEDYNKRSLRLTEVKKKYRIPINLFLIGAAKKDQQIANEVGRRVMKEYPEGCARCIRCP
jgi:hypothetical protein